MAYTPFTWHDGPGGNTPIVASRLNHMEQGIADAHGLADDAQAAADAAQAGVNAIGPERFQISGNLGGDRNLSILPEDGEVLQTIVVVVPAGKTLTLRRVRFALYFESRLRIRRGTLTVVWTSSATAGEETPNVPIASEGSHLISVEVFNPSDSNETVLQPRSGWWLDFAIE